MAEEQCEVRAIRENDDFVAIERMYFDTNWAEQFSSSDDPKYRKTDWRQLLFPQEGREEQHVLRKLATRGFVAVHPVLGIVAFATVGISSASSNGYFEYGVSDASPTHLGRLIDCCRRAVLEAGGSRLYAVKSMRLGEIRNPRISFMESIGFECSPYYHVFGTHDQVGDWAPLQSELDYSRIKPVEDLSAKQIADLLEQDGEPFLAEEFQGQFAERTPDHVFLGLYDESGKNLKGISYYKVWERDGSYSAMALGIHFRPSESCESTDIRLLISATMISLQQLNVTSVWTRVSSQHMQQLFELYAAGFEFAQTHSVVLYQVCDGA